MNTTPNKHIIAISAVAISNIKNVEAFVVNASNKDNPDTLFANLTFTYIDIPKADTVTAEAFDVAGKYKEGDIFLFVIDHNDSEATRYFEACVEQLGPNAMGNFMPYFKIEVSDNDGVFIGPTSDEKITEALTLVDKKWQEEKARLEENERQLNAVLKLDTKEPETPKIVFSNILVCASAAAIAVVQRLSSESVIGYVVLSATDEVGILATENVIKEFDGSNPSHMVRVYMLGDDNNVDWNTRVADILQKYTRVLDVADVLTLEHTIDGKMSEEEYKQVKERLMAAYERDGQTKAKPVGSAEEVKADTAVTAEPEVNESNGPKVHLIIAGIDSYAAVIGFMQRNREHAKHLTISVIHNPQDEPEEKLAKDLFDHRLPWIYKKGDVCILVVDEIYQDHAAVNATKSKVMTLTSGDYAFLWVAPKNVTKAEMNQSDSLVISQIEDALKHIGIHIAPPTHGFRSYSAPTEQLADVPKHDSASPGKSLRDLIWRAQPFKHSGVKTSMETEYNNVTRSNVKATYVILVDEMSSRLVNSSPNIRNLLGELEARGGKVYSLHSPVSLSGRSVQQWLSDFQLQITNRHHQDSRYVIVLSGRSMVEAGMANEIHRVLAQTICVDSTQNAGNVSLVSVDDALSTRQVQNYLYAEIYKSAFPAPAIYIPTLAERQTTSSAPEPSGAMDPMVKENFVNVQNQLRSLEERMNEMQRSMQGGNVFGPKIPGGYPLGGRSMNGFGKPADLMAEAFGWTGNPAGGYGGFTPMAGKHPHDQPSVVFYAADPMAASSLQQFMSLPQTTQLKSLVNVIALSGDQISLEQLVNSVKVPSEQVLPRIYVIDSGTVTRPVPLGSAIRNAAATLPAGFSVHAEPIMMAHLPFVANTIIMEEAAKQRS